MQFANVMKNSIRTSSIADYLRKRLTPTEEMIPNIDGLEMFGCSVPAETAGGDFFEYINFPKRFDIEQRIEKAKSQSGEFLSPLPPNSIARNAVDEHIIWLRRRTDYQPEFEVEYRHACSLQQLRVAEELRILAGTTGVLLVDAQGHGIISAKIASTVHDAFQALMLSELDQRGKVSLEMFEELNLRLSESIAARNVLGRDEESSREIATLLYGELRASGQFRFLSFGHPCPLVFSANSQAFIRLNETPAAQFPPLGLEIPVDHPDRSMYVSLPGRERSAVNSDIEEVSLMRPGDILFLYTDGVFDGESDERNQLEAVIRAASDQSARNICYAVMDYALERDDLLRDLEAVDRIDDKTVFIIKRSE